MKDKILHDMYAHSAIREILISKDFISLNQFCHHGDQSRLVHSVKVARMVFVAAKIRNLDYVSATRAALLHDFYFYDNTHIKKRYHLRQHPRIALENALGSFSLNAIERDTIANHMWPITVKRPQYKESRLVSMVDKMISLSEMKKKAGVSMRNARKRLRNKQMPFVKGERVRRPA